MWDTVATLGLTTYRFLGLAAAVVGGVGVLALLLDLLMVRFYHAFDASLFWASYLRIAGIGAVAAGIAYLVAYVKFTTKSSRPWYETLHVTGWKMVFYSTELNRYVQHARHALSIDENRKDFQNVAWTKDDETVTVQKKGEDIQLVQMWFAGVHSDIGGGYIENEGRLSDITLAWMIEQATQVPDPLIVDRSVLQLWPSAAGPQHDERKGIVDGWPAWFVWLLMRVRTREALGWEPWVRKIPRNAPLHPTVLDRFRVQAPGVLLYDEAGLYRPKALEAHTQTHTFYPPPKSV